MFTLLVLPLLDGERKADAAKFDCETAATVDIVAVVVVVAIVPPTTNSVLTDSNGSKPLLSMVLNSNARVYSRRRYAEYYVILADV